MWIQTSYNTSNNQHKNGGIALRGNYAGIGSIWDEENQIFWPKKPYTSWVKNITEARWQSPIGDEPTLTAEQEADTTNKYSYLWNEDEQSWNLFTIEV